jgi:6-phosphogluconolactonase
MDVHVVAPTEVGATAANLMGATLDAAVAARGHATLALSGGTTPAAMLTELATQSLPWERIHVFQVDERVAPDGSSERNLSVLRACLIDRIVLPEENLHPMPVTEADLDAAADRYAARLHLHAGDPPTLMSCTSASASTGTRPRSCRGTRCWRSTTATSRQQASTGATGG